MKNRRALYGVAAFLALLSPAVMANSPRESRQMALEGFDIISDTAATPAMLARGLELTRMAAEADDPVALNNLGYLAASGRLSNVPGLECDTLVSLSPQRAAYYYQRALSHRMTSAAINLLELLKQYPDVKVPSESVAEAHMLIARAFALGNSVLPYDFDLAQTHFLEAARLGNEDALRIVRETIGQFPDAYGNLTPEDEKLIFGE